MTRETVLLLTLIVYMAVLLGIGLLARRRNEDAGDFFLGGRRLGPLVSAIGASASSSSVWTLLGVSGAAWLWGLSAVWLFPACVGGFALNWFVLAPALQRFSHRTGSVTIADALVGEADKRWKRRIYPLAALIILVSLGAYVAAQFQGAGKIFATIFDVEPEMTIVIGAAVVLLYTMLGGLWAVSLTDTVQGLMMALTALVLPLAALIHVGGFAGLATQLESVPVEGYLALGGPRPGIVAVGFVLGLLGIGLGYPGQPHVLKYFMALRDEPGAMKQARRIALSWAVVIYAGMILLGLCGRAMFGTLEALDGDKERVFIHATADLFDPITGGILLAAVLSAIMSTADSQLLVASSTVVHDLGLKGRTPQGTLLLSRLAVVVLTIIAAGAAMTGSQEIFARVLFGWAAMGAAFGPLLLVRVVLRRPIAPPRVFAAMLAGAGLSVVAYFFHADLLGTAQWGGLAKYVVPWFVALAIALGGGAPSEAVEPP